MTNIAELMRESAAVVKANEFTVDDLPSAFQDDPSGYLDGLAERLEQAAAELERAEPVGEIVAVEACGHSGTAEILYRDLPAGTKLYADCPPNSTVPDLEKPVAWAWEYDGRYMNVDRNYAAELETDGETVIPLYRRPPTSAVPDGWKITRFTGTDFGDGSRWEIYDETGAGGSVDERDVRDWLVRKLLDRLSAAPQGGSDSE